MSEQWYCHKCGIVEVIKDYCCETDTLYVQCAVCKSIATDQVPQFITDLQAKLTATEAELARAREALIFMWAEAGAAYGEPRESAEQHYEREIAQGEG